MEKAGAYYTSVHITITKEGASCASVYTVKTLSKQVVEGKIGGESTIVV